MKRAHTVAVGTVAALAVGYIAGIAVPAAANSETSRVPVTGEHKNYVIWQLKAPASLINDDGAPVHDSIKVDFCQPTWDTGRQIHIHVGTPFTTILGNGTTQWDARTKWAFADRQEVPLSTDTVGMPMYRAVSFFKGQVLVGKIGSGQCLPVETR